MRCFNQTSVTDRVFGTSHDRNCVTGTAIVRRRQLLELRLLHALDHGGAYLLPSKRISAKARAAALECISSIMPLPSWRPAALQAFANC